MAVSTDEFKNRLREVRELRDLSQGELARRAGLPPSAVSHFESGSRKPSFANLRRLAEELQVTSDYLLGRSDDLMGDGPATALFRDLDKLTAEDLEYAKQFMESLAQRRTKTDKDSP
ncbi:MAG: helix-turn-helix domain-containing protein [Gammaproteobacteria bacterium]|nr:helix-turn-helix domain-containing protein [Gammaproteobacteria bacterium]